MYDQNQPPRKITLRLKEHQECGICVCDFEIGEHILALGCSTGEAKHLFHRHCLDEMVQFNKNKHPPQSSFCPYCKADVLPARFKHHIFRGLEEPVSIADVELSESVRASVIVDPE